MITTGATRGHLIWRADGSVGGRGGIFIRAGSGVHALWRDDSYERGEILRDHYPGGKKNHSSTSGK